MKVLRAAFAGLTGAALVLFLAACAGAPAPGSDPAAGSTAVVAAAGNGLLRNPSFEIDGRGEFPGWEMLEHSRGNSYRFTADVQGAYSAPSSLRINRYGDEDWGLLRQMVPVKPEWLGRKARVSGMLRTEGVNHFGGALIVQSRGAGDNILTWNHMPESRVFGNTPWAPAQVEVKIHPQAQLVLVGVLLEGGGTLWADDLKLEIVD